MAKAKKSKVSRQVLRERTRLEWVLFILLLIIGYLLLASHYVWWPSHKTYENLGTAFYAGIKPANAGAAADSGTSTTATSSTGSTGSGGSTNGNGSGGTTGSGSGGGGTTTSSDSSILTFAGGLNTGDSKQDVDGRANGLTENCAVVVNTSSVGKQEVCTYTQGDKIITVTYLNDHVVSASRSGF